MRIVDLIYVSSGFMDLKCTKIDSQEPKESNDVRFVALGCIVFELSACENSAENFLLKVAGINCHLIIFTDFSIGI